MASVYHAVSLIKSYAGRRILDVEELNVDPGEILAVVGPSGAGKSTLLRLFNFLEVPDSGKLRFFDRPIEFGKVPVEVQRSVTTVFQRPSLLSGSVASNILFGLRLRGKRDGHEELERLLDQVGLVHLAHKQALNLSGGEAQRVALARALILQPKVLLLDEPTANLDPYNVELIESVIRNLNKASQTTMILVTHNIFQARRLADRVIFLLNGKVIEDTDSQTFFENPTDPRTRAFVRGEMVW